jgi:hypothetical protein
MWITIGLTNFFDKNYHSLLSSSLPSLIYSKAQPLKFGNIQKISNIPKEVYFNIQHA